MRHPEERFQAKSVPSKKVICLAAPIVQNDAFPSQAADGYGRTNDNEKIEPRTGQDVNDLRLSQHFPELAAKHHCPQERPRAADAFTKLQALWKRQVRSQESGRDALLIH